MRKIVLLLILIIAGTVSALNAGLDVWQDKPVYYENETVELNLNLTNYDIDWSLSDAKLIVNSTYKDFNIPIGSVSPGDSIFKKISLDKFERGNYRLTAYLEHTFLGVTDVSDQQVVQVRVEPAEPIVMQDKHILINEIQFPEEIEINKEFQVRIKVDSTFEEGKLLLQLDDSDVIEYSLEEGGQVIEETLTTNTPGQHVVTLKAYSLDEQLRDFKSKQFIAIDTGLYKPVEKKDLQQAEKKVEISGTKKLERNVINEIGCFIIGGCEGDIEPPKILLTEVNQADDLISNVIVIADDTEYGGSTVSSCSLRVNQGPLMQMTELVSELNGSRKTYEILLNLGIDSVEFISFSCVDEYGNTGYHKYEIIKKKGRVKIQVSDNQINSPISKCEIHIDGSLKGFTDYNGVFETELYAGSHSLLLKARGYGEKDVIFEVISDKTADLSINLIQSYETKFTPPTGYERWIKANKAAGTQIHPLEDHLRSYSYPLYSTERIDVARDLITVIDKFITYDTTCLETPRPQSCQAWHDSEYDIIETGKGVCYDWATLGVSFSDSYGIPARYNRGCWETADIFGKTKVSCHAWQQVFFEGRGWIHMDTLWNEFDNPCVYSKGADCFFAGKYYDPDEGEYISLETYDCGKRCVDDVYQNIDEMPLEEWGFEKEYHQSIKLIDNNCIVELNKKADLQEAEKLKAFAQNDSIPEQQILNYFENILVDRFDIGSEQMQLMITYNNNEVEWIGVNFSLDCNILYYKDSFVTDQYTGVNYSVTTDIKPVFISPNPSKIVDKTYYWLFDKPGEHAIEFKFAEEKYAFIIPEDPVKDVLGEVISSKTNGTSMREYEPLSEYSKVFILGYYTEISNSIEDKIRESGLEVQRIEDDAGELSIKMALMFYQKPSEVVISTLYDYDSIHGAGEYAASGKIPLIIADGENDKRIISAIMQLKPSKLIVADTSSKLEPELIEKLRKTSEIEYLRIETKETLALNLIEIRKKDRGEGSNILVYLVYGTILLIICGIILGAYLKFKKR